MLVRVLHIFLLFRCFEFRTTINSATNEIWCMVTASQMWLARNEIVNKGCEKMACLTNRYQCVLFVLIYGWLL